MHRSVITLKETIEVLRNKKEKDSTTSRVNLRGASETIPVQVFPHGK